MNMKRPNTGLDPLLGVGLGAEYHIHGSSRYGVEKSFLAAKSVLSSGRIRRKDEISLISSPRKSAHPPRSQSLVLIAVASASIFKEERLF